MNCPRCDTPSLAEQRFCERCGGSLPGPVVREQLAGLAPALVAAAGTPGGPPLPAKSTRSADAEGVFAPGTVIGGKYTIVNLLGEGGMGCVYTAEQQLGATRRKVAVKTLHMHLSRDEKVRARFEREVSTIASLEHPNTIQVFDFGTTEDGVLYIVMELAVGRNLGDAIAQEGAFETARSVKILQQIAGSLQEAHARGVVHRDLKPDNIMLCDRAGQRDFVKVLDFGIAKTQTSDVDARKLTLQGTVLGTPPYMSPEQFVGDNLDGRSDVYSLGIIAYELATGTLPFVADTAYEWATRHMTEAPTPFEAHPKGLLAPPAYREAVYRALRKERGERFATPQDFADALTAVDPRGYQTVKHAGPATGAIAAAHAGAIGPGSTMRGDEVAPLTGSQQRASNPGYPSGSPPASNYGVNAYGPSAYGAPGVHPMSPPYGNAAYGSPGYAGNGHAPGYGPPGTPAYGLAAAGAGPMPYGNAGSLHVNQPKSRTGLYVALAIISALSLCAIGVVLFVTNADPPPVATPAAALTTTTPSTATASATASNGLGVALAPVTSRTDPSRPQAGPGAGLLRPNGGAGTPASGTTAQPSTQLITPNLAWTAIPVITIPQIPGMPGQAQPPQTQPPQTPSGAEPPPVIRPSVQQQEQAAVCSRARAARVKRSANADDLDRRCRELGGTP
jgi:eukaryotic-like serine/threonine-protein kinase